MFDVLVLILIRQGVGAVFLEDLPGSRELPGGELAGVVHGSEHHHGLGVQERNVHPDL